MKKKIKYSIITMIAIVAIIVDIIWDLLLWVNAYVDGKYLIEPYGNHHIDDTYYMRIGSLSIAMFINLGVAIVALYLLWRKNNDKDKPPVHKPAQNGFCKVCGYKLNYLPWGEDGETPCFDICPCCGVEFGNEDYTEESLKEYRAKWISEGAHWFDPNLQPQNWSLQEQISNIRPNSEDLHISE